jgi:hypothetical protein
VKGRSRLSISRSGNPALREKWALLRSRANSCKRTGLRFTASKRPRNAGLRWGDKAPMTAYITAALEA